RNSFETAIAEFGQRLIELRDDLQRRAARLLYDRTQRVQVLRQQDNPAVGQPFDAFQIAEELGTRNGDAGQAGSVDRNEPALDIRRRQGEVRTGNIVADDEQRVGVEVDTGRLSRTRGSGRCVGV